MAKYSGGNFIHGAAKGLEQTELMKLAMAGIYGAQIIY